MQRAKLIMTNVGAVGLGAFSGGAGFEYLIGSMLGAGVGSTASLATSSWGDYLRSVDRMMQINKNSSPKSKKKYIH